MRRACVTGLFLLISGFMQAFIERSNSLVTCSKDGYVRVWDLGTQHCYQILLGQQGEVDTSTILKLPDRPSFYHALHQSFSQCFHHSSCSYVLQALVQALHLGQPGPQLPFLDH